MRKIRDADRGSERTCLVTRTKGQPESMIRFVLDPNGAVVPDISRKLPGRGVWVTASADRVAEAIKRQAFSRGFKTKVRVSERLADEIEALLTTDCLQALSLANKAGLVITGLTKVEHALAEQLIAGLIQATDGGADGERKLKAALNRRPGGAPATPQLKLFSSSQLDLALGRTNVIHAALTEGPAAKGFLRRFRRLALYRNHAVESLDRPGSSGPEAASINDHEMDRNEIGGN
ncbi:MAG TPA: RNA-binding protein [Methylocella sp.]|nr:RNA-binding protein [Methylocella sp.]